MSAASLSFLVAGFETTYNTLSLVFYFLAVNPHVQDKLVQEIKEAKSSKGDLPFYDFIQSISYLEWVLLETLRIVPIGYRHFRTCLETCTIDGICFPKGVSIDIAVYSLHHDPNIWPQPQRFIPQVRPESSLLSCCCF